jgi:hypothetical protein
MHIFLCIVSSQIFGNTLDWQKSELGCFRILIAQNIQANRKLKPSRALHVCRQELVKLGSHSGEYFAYESGFPYQIFTSS